MARIRTIKPEFPQSESMGRVSRDARLLFVMLWPICDDHGRTRASSRMLASLLFPYDDDAPSLISGWLAELVREGCIKLYAHDGSSYLEVCNWLKHQKIDKPSKPAFPAFDESSRDLANTLEPSPLDQGPRTKEWRGEERKKEPASPSGSRLPADWSLPTDWRDWAAKERPDVNPEREAASFADFWHGKAGADARKADWQATWRNWIRRANGGQRQQANGTRQRVDL